VLGATEEDAADDTQPEALAVDDEDRNRAVTGQELGDPGMVEIPPAASRL
jgi:hypothetical protein